MLNWAKVLDCSCSSALLLAILSFNNLIAIDLLASLNFVFDTATISFLFSIKVFNSGWLTNVTTWCIWSNWLAVSHSFISFLILS